MGIPKGNVKSYLCASIKHVISFIARWGQSLKPIVKLGNTHSLS